MVTLIAFVAGGVAGFVASYFVFRANPNKKAKIDGTLDSLGR
jgi:hypothetical protein